MLARVLPSATTAPKAFTSSLEAPAAAGAVPAAYGATCSLLKQGAGAPDPQLSGQFRPAAATAVTALIEHTTKPPVSAALAAAVSGLHHGTALSSQKCHASLHQLQAVSLCSPTPWVSPVPPLPLLLSHSVSFTTQHYCQQQDQQDQQQQPGNSREMLGRGSMEKVP